MATLRQLKRGDILWAAGLVLFVAAFYLVLEHFSPYYFLEDDNRDYTLPLFVHLYRNIRADKTSGLAY